MHMRKSPRFLVFSLRKKEPRPRPTPPANSSTPISATRIPSPSIPPSSPVQTKSPHAKEKIELRRIEIKPATEKELKIIPGVGPVMASRIIAARPFQTADDLKKVNEMATRNT